MSGARRRDVIPTRAMLRELKAEQQVATEGREFLDQKRMLLATEILRGLRELEKLRSELDALEREATEAMARAVARHGLEGLSCYAADPVDVALDVERDQFIGVELVRARVADDGMRVAEGPQGGSGRAIHPSPEARRCARAFRAMVPLLVRLAALSGTLQRLGHEYRQTDRRVRALERVLMPEIDQTLRSVEEILEEQDQEEAIYARLPHRK